MSTPQSSGNDIQSWASGWVAFAGFILIMVGIFWMFAGFAGLLEDETFVVTRNYVITWDATTWGWIHLIGGAIATLAGFYVFTGNILARIVGILVALSSALVNFAYVPYYPIWSILIISLNVIVIWALAVYGKEEAEARGR